MTASFVLDSSMALTWYFQDEATPATKSLLDGMADETALVPAFWFVELINVLALSERKGRISPSRVTDFIALIDGFDLEIDKEDPTGCFSRLLPLCRSHHLTSYDAIYLDLAMRRQLPLATLDEPLRKAARKLGVKLLG